MMLEASALESMCEEGQLEVYSMFTLLTLSGENPLGLLVGTSMKNTTTPELLLSYLLDSVQVRRNSVHDVVRVLE